MKYIVLDLEMNAPSRSIIQIGATCVDLTTGKELNKFDVLINPEETIDPFITNLTGITQEMADGGKPIWEALYDFWQWVSDCKVVNIASWGTDYYQVTEESKALGVQYPSKLRFLNIKEFASVFRSCFPQAKQRGGLKATMELFGLSFVGTQHRAYDDSVSAALILIQLQNNMKKFFETQKILR